MSDSLKLAQKVKAKRTAKNSVFLDLFQDKKNLLKLYQTLHPEEIVDKIKNKDTYIKSLKDTWLDTTSSNPYNDFLLTIMSGLSQLERDLISQRTKEGLVSAKARGRNGGRPSKQNEKAEMYNIRVSMFRHPYLFEKILLWRVKRCVIIQKEQSCYRVR